MKGRKSVGSEDRDLIRRLLDATPDGPTSPAPPPVAPPPTPPEPEGATFLVHDQDWDHREDRSAVSRAAAAASDAGRRGLDRLRHPAERDFRTARLAIFAIAVIGALAGFGIALVQLLNDPLAEAHVYYEAAARLNAGQPLYPVGVDPSSNLAYRYPPLLGLVLRPLALLPYEWFALGWEIVVVGSFALLVRHVGVRSQRTWLAIGLLGIPIGWALSIAQAQVPMTLLMAIGQPWSVALAANLALFPALLALWWIGRRDWQATIAFVFWMVLLGLAQVVLEPGGSGAFLRTIGLSEVGNVNNISPFAVSPELWAALVAAGVAATLVLSRTRWGWPAAVTMATLASPRLLIYMLTGLLASLREPKQANLEEPEARPWLRVSGSGRH